MVLRRILSELFVCAIGVGQAAAQDVSVPRDTTISLQRTACYGPCPIYTVRIDAQGDVTYHGVAAVRVVGERKAHIDPAVIARLLATIDRIDFFELRDRYLEIENPDGTRMNVTDLPTKMVTVTANGRRKQVEDYIGAPDDLEQLEREIDEAAGTKRWIFIDDAELEELVRSGWSASSNEGAKLLEEAIGRDDIPITRRLIGLGADLNGHSEHPLLLLYLARSAAMVDLLVRAGGDPNERTRYGAQTPLFATAHKDAAVAEALLKAGARLEDVENERSGHTALWYAACAGNWRVVSVLLSAGANPRGSTAMSATDCTRQVRQFETMYGRRSVLDRGRPTVEDFDKVLALLANAEQRIKR